MGNCCRRGVKRSRQRSRSLSVKEIVTSPPLLNPVDTSSVETSVETSATLTWPCLTENKTDGDDSKVTFEVEIPQEEVSNIKREIVIYEIPPSRNSLIKPKSVKTMTTRSSYGIRGQKTPILPLKSSFKTPLQKKSYSGPPRGMKQVSIKTIYKPTSSLSTKSKEPRRNVKSNLIFLPRSKVSNLGKVKSVSTKSSTLKDTSLSGSKVSNLGKIKSVSTKSTTLRAKSSIRSKASKSKSKSRKIKSVSTRETMSSPVPFVEPEDSTKPSESEVILEGVKPTFTKVTLRSRSRSTKSNLENSVIDGNRSKEKKKVNGVSQSTSTHWKHKKKKQRPRSTFGSSKGTYEDRENVPYDDPKVLNRVIFENKSYCTDPSFCSTEPCQGTSDLEDLLQPWF